MLKCKTLIALRKQSAFQASISSKVLRWMEVFRIKTNQKINSQKCF